MDAVKAGPGEPQVFIEADPDGNGAYRYAIYIRKMKVKEFLIHFCRFVVMTEEDAGALETTETVEVR